MKTILLFQCTLVSRLATFPQTRNPHLNKHATFPPIRSCSYRPLLRILRLNSYKVCPFNSSAIQIVFQFSKWWRFAVLVRDSDNWSAYTNFGLLFPVVWFLCDQSIRLRSEQYLPFLPRRSIIMIIIAFDCCFLYLTTK